MSRTHASILVSLLVTLASPGAVAATAPAGLRSMPTLSEKRAPAPAPKPHELHCHWRVLDQGTAGSRVEICE